jgi:hypothetical protein
MATTTDSFFSAGSTPSYLQTFAQFLPTTGTSSQSSGSTVAASGQRTPEQEAALKALLAKLQESSGGVTPYTGQLTAPLSGLENLSLTALEQKIMEQVKGTGVSAATEKALTDMLKSGGSPVDFNAYYKNAIEDPALKDFTQNILPTITQKYGSSGAFGSDKKLAEQTALDNFNKQLVAARSTLAYQSQNDAQNRIIQALGLAPNIETAGTADLTNLMTAAGLPRVAQQADLTAQYQEFQRQQQQKQTNIDAILKALGLTTSSSTSQQSSSSGSGTSDLIKTGITAAAAAFLSDRRMKSDIVLVTPLQSGLNLYQFRYKHDPALLHYGVMADEVEELLPAAIILRDDGMKLVDYHMLSWAGLLQ